MSATPPPPPPSSQTPFPAGAGSHAPASQIERDITAIKDRLLREATSAVGMVEAALDALWRLDREAAREIRRRDEEIDREEVEIEEACLRVIALQHPVARDLRQLTFMLKVNSDVERVADHACAIAKVVKKVPPGEPPRWPTALRELAERVPMVCHALLRALRDEDEEAAKAIVVGDEVIDSLHRRLFDETLDLMGESPNARLVGLLVYRLGRDLERIADLMTNIAEDIIYLRTGQIARHTKKQLRAESAAAENGGVES